MLKFLIIADRAVAIISGVVTTPTNWKILIETQQLL